MARCSHCDLERMYRSYEAKKKRLAALEAQKKEETREEPQTIEAPTKNIIEQVIEGEEKEEE